MLELYFIFYRTPKIMTRLARERNRSAVKWSLLGIAAWIGGEFFVAFAVGTIYEIGVITLSWPASEPKGLVFLTYILALLGAILSVSLVARILRSKTTDETFPVPPPPPEFVNANVK